MSDQPTDAPQEPDMSAQPIEYSPPVQGPIQGPSLPPGFIHARDRVVVPPRAKHQRDHMATVAALIQRAPSAAARQAAQDAADRRARMSDEERADLDERERAAEDARIAAEVRAEHVAERAAWWAAQVPATMRDATLASLDAEQNPDGKVTRWYESGSRVLVLYSAHGGTGKTHTAYAIGNAAAADGQWVVAVTAAALFKALRPTNGMRDNTAERAFRRFTRCDLLIVDDLGHEKSTEWTTEQLHEVLNERAVHGRRLIVTTNRSGERMVETYDGPTVDRLIDGMTYIVLTGQGRRRAHLWG